MDNLVISQLIPAVPTTKTWNFNGSGSWHAPGYWDPSVAPDGNDQTVIFGSVLSAPSTVIVDSGVTVKELQFNHTVGYVVAGTGTVTLEADAGNASISVTNTGGPVTHEIQAQVSLGSETDVDVAASTTLEFNNRLDLGTFNLNKTGTGQLLVNNEVVSAGGAFSLTAGVIGGSGSIGGDLENSGGTVSPGNSPGVLTIEGDYHQSTGGKLRIELGGLTVGQDYDMLDVGGEVLLEGGTLEVLLLDGFTPSAGDLFDILDFGSLSGSFDAIDLPAGIAWDTSQLLTGGTLSVAAVPEPASLILLGIAGLVMLCHRER